MVRMALEKIGVEFGRLPVLILDQFDDYQLSTRERFLGTRKDWIKPAELARKNQTWASIRDLMQTQKMRLVVVTRSDASAGLHSVRFGDRAEGTTIGRLGVQWLAQWLAQITADDGKGEVIANPDSGWTDLRARLERDLTPVGAAAGVVLPQQVRIVFLGLAKLKTLTLSDYRKALAAGGIEGLYVHYAILSAASSSGYAADNVRSLLKAFIDQDQSGNIKTKELSLKDIEGAGAHSEGLDRALERLRRDEIIREKPGAEGDPTRWRLDHDYIARAILAESRYANRLMQQIEEGNAAWSAAGRNIGQWYRSLLPLTTQARLLWVRLRPGGGFVDGPYRLYAAQSVVRTLPIIIVLSVGGLLWRQEAIRASMTQIAEGLNSDPSMGAAAALSLWGAAPAVRDAVVDHLLNSPARLQAAGTDWVQAYTSIEPEAAARLVDRLRDRLAKPDLDADTRRSLINAYGGAATRLDPPEAAKEASDLRDRLAKPDLDADTRRSLINAYGGAATRLDPPEAAKEASDLRDRLAKPDLDADTRRSLIYAYGRAAARLDPPEAAKAASDLRDRLAKPDLDADTRGSLIDAYRSAAARLDPPEAAKAASDLRDRLAKPELDANTRGSLIDAYGSAAARLDPPEAAKAASDLRDRLAKPDLDADTRGSLIYAYGSAAARLDPPEAAKAASDLRDRLAKPDLDADTRRSLIRAYGSAAARLDPPEAAKAASDLRDRLAKPDLDADTRGPLIYAYGSAAARLDPPEAAKAASDLRDRLAKPDLDADTRGSLIDAYRSAAARLDPPEAAKAASDLRDRLAKPDLDADTRGSLIDAYGSAAARLDPPEAAKAASDLRDRLAKPDLDADTRGSLIYAYGSAAARLDPPEAAKAASDLRDRLAKPDLDADTRRSLIRAYGSAAARLDPPEAAKAASDLRDRLAKPDLDADTEMALVDAEASLVIVPAAQPTQEQLEELRLALASVAWPLRNPDDSPAWEKLEKISRAYSESYGFELDSPSFWRLIR